MSELLKNWVDPEAPQLAIWAENVLSKLMDEGIVPKYIERTEDYESLYRTICNIFSILVEGGRQFNNLSNQQALLKEYLIQRNLYFGSKEVDLITLNSLKENFKSLIEKRGTEQIFTQEGELSRVIDREITDEFIYNILTNYNSGWILDVSSPDFNGISRSGLNVKVFEKTKDIVNLEAYPIKEDGGEITDALVEIIEDEDKQILKLSNILNNHIVGIFSNSIIIDPSLSYEVSFYVKKTLSFSNLNIQIIGEDIYSTPLQLLSTVTGLGTNDVLRNWSLALVDNYYFVRVIIYNKDILAYREKLNIGFGNNLILRANIVKINLNIFTTGGASAEVLHFWDIKMRPLESPFTKGFISPPKILKLWLKNNNKSFLERNGVLSKLEYIIRKFLISYDLELKVKYLKNE